ncbi:MAG: ribosome small subunit-dependent GTPase A [Ruminococcaceae bacterium]|nr:ribosome small subunit-dependent GTPase A [Oscillospiraceae bacterium]
MADNATGRIIKGVGGLYTVRLDSGDIQCRARGSFRHTNITPLVGDVVKIEADDKGNSVIDEILDRKNSLIRPPLANIDYVFVTMAAASPKPMLDMTDKLCAILEHNGITPIIVIGKCELDREAAQNIKDVYSKAGYEVFVLSCETGEGIDEIKEFVSVSLSGKISAFAGASGVGKSTLMNKLFPELELGTGEVSRKVERGKHTTRTVTLFEVCSGGGYLADTPGFSMLDFDRFDFFDIENLPNVFPEIHECVGLCRYTKCSHTKEDGCAVLKKVRSGQMAKSRHDSYIELYNTLKNKPKWNK